MIVSRRLSALLAVALLAGCAGGTRPPGEAAPPRSAHRPMPPAHHAPPPVQVLALPGLEGVIGASADGLARQFGSARLDVWEGDARKLQYAGSACVLDVYLYPRTSGDEPRATYVEARRASDGQEVDRAACVSALRRPQPGPGH